MQVMVIKAEHAKGVAKATQKDYEMCLLTIGTPAESYSGPNRVSIANGLKVEEVPLDVNAFEQFRNVKLPAMLDIVIEPDPRNFRRNVVTGIRKG